MKYFILMLLVAPMTLFGQSETRYVDGELVTISKFSLEKKETAPIEVQQCYLSPIVYGSVIPASTKSCTITDAYGKQKAIKFYPQSDFPTTYFPTGKFFISNINVLKGETCYVRLHNARAKQVFERLVTSPTQIIEIETSQDYTIEISFIK